MDSRTRSLIIFVAVLRIIVFAIYVFGAVKIYIAISGLSEELVILAAIFGIAYWAQCFMHLIAATYVFPKELKFLLWFVKVVFSFLFAVGVAAARVCTDCHGMDDLQMLWRMFDSNSAAGWARILFVFTLLVLLELFADSLITLIIQIQEGNTATGLTPGIGNPSSTALSVQEHSESEPLTIGPDRSGQDLTSAQTTSATSPPANQGHTAPIGKKKKLRSPMAPGLSLIGGGVPPKAGHPK